MSGLRESKKRATREALGTAARRLAVEVGPDNVRVADIAAAAGVAPRTYNGYFASREEAICALYADRADRVAAAVRDRPPDEPLHTAVEAVLAREFLGPDPDRPALLLITREPALRGEFLRDLATMEEPLAAAIRDRTAGADAASPGAEAVAAAAVAAARVALGCWLEGADDEPFAAVVARAWAAIGAATPPRTRNGT